MEEKYILSLDIGTTTIRSFIYNSRTEIVGKAVDQVFIGFIFKQLKMFYTSFIDFRFQNSRKMMHFVLHYSVRKSESPTLFRSSSFFN